MTRSLRIEKSNRGIYEPVLTEEHVISQIVPGLVYRGFKVFRIVERIPRRGRCGQVIGKFSTPGIPDLHVRKGPIQFWIEAKRPGGKRRPAQERWISEALADGVRAFFAEGWDDVERMLKIYGFID